MSSTDDLLEIEHLISKLIPEDAETVRDYLSGGDLERRSPQENARLSIAVHALACAAMAVIRCAVCRSLVPVIEAPWNSFAARSREPICINCETKYQRERRVRIEYGLLVDHPKSQVGKRLLEMTARAENGELATVAQRLLPRVGLPMRRRFTKRVYMSPEIRARLSQLARERWVRKRADETA